MSIKDYDLTPANNATAPGINWAEGMPPGDVNDSARQMMADIRRSWEQLELATWGGTSTGAANAYEITPVIGISVTPSTYTAGAMYAFASHQANTGAATLNVSGVGATAIQYAGAALVGGEIPASGTVTVLYDGTAFQLLTPGLPGAVLQVVQGETITESSTTSTSYVASNVSVSITPRSTSSKILVSASFTHGLSGSQDNVNAFSRLFRDSTGITPDIDTMQLNVTGATALNWRALQTLEYFDSPASAAALTYAVHHKIAVAGTTSRIIQGTITAREIAG